MFIEENAKKNLLMVLGVVEIEQEILDVASSKLEYNRKPEFSKLLEQVFCGLQYLHQTKTPVYLIASSGTGMMEGALSNVLSQGDSALYINGGVFGQRWGDICKKHGIKTTEIKLGYGQTVNPQDIKTALDSNSNIQVVFATQNETSTGTLTDIKAIAEIIKNYPDVILVVDAISSILVEPLYMDEWGVDVVVSSGNKALALPPGIGFFAFSEKAMKKVKQAKNVLYNFDVMEYEKEWQRNSTPYTPPIALVKQLAKRLEKIFDEGLENTAKRYKNNTEYLRNGVEKLGLEFFTKNMANCVTGIITPKGIDAYRVVEILRDKHKIDVAPSWPDLKSRMFRVGNFGNIGKTEIDKFLTALKETLKELQ